MARTVTLAVLRANARLYADQRGRKFVEDPDLDRLLNLALAELYDRLVAARGHEYYETASTAITTANGTATYQLPADHYQTLDFALNWGTDRLESVPALGSIADRSRFNGIGWGEFTPKAFRERGAEPPTSTSARLIELFPTPTGAVATELRYIPNAPTLAHADDAFDGVNGWDKLIALRAALEMRTFAGLDIGGTRDLYDRECSRIDEMAADRAAAHPATIRDVLPEGSPFDDWWRRLPPPA